jgi:hypothetical protein
VEQRSKDFTSGLWYEKVADWVSVDDIYEKIESWEDVVQSIDTVMFQKL